MAQKHLRAVNKVIRAADLDCEGLDAALVEFLRDSARQIDAKGMDGVSAALISAYLSAQKDVSRAVARKPAKIPPESAPDEPSEAPDAVDEPDASEGATVTKLDAFMQRHTA
ncbi:hypothetical protein [Microbacterium sp. NPDC089696]|uniref:hypothetical protein n=1 Tax=Microbacterium sp. NPDC089696 TaxID=3364199 RepID=UPI003803CBAA